MPKRRHGPGGRPRDPRLPRKASKLIRRELERALTDNHKPAAFLAGKTGRMERKERTVRLDFTDRYGIKLDAALFLVRRAFDEELVNYREYFRLRSAIELCYPRSRDLTAAGRFAIPGGFFMATDLEGEVIAAVDDALPRLKDSGRRAVWTAVHDVLAAAAKRAHRAGVPQAYAEHVYQHISPPTAAEIRDRADAYSWGRDQLGDEAVNIVIEDETALYYQDFLDD
jgi:hypothetical protein